MAFDSGAFDSASFEVAGGGGGSSYTLACAAGAYSIAGNSARLAAAHRVTAAQGSYTITGNPAALRAAHRLTAASGAYAITGNAAVLRAAHRMTAATGAYSITGNAANLVYTPPGTVLVAASGTYVITGNPVTMRADYRLVAEVGQYTISGSAVANPGETPPEVGGGGGAYGGGGNIREVRKFADLLDKARPTKAAKKRLRRVLEVEALELLPDEPEAVKAASIIAQVVAKKEIQAIERRPATEPLKALPFDPSEMIRQMVEEWLANESIRQELEDEDDESTLLLMD